MAQVSGLMWPTITHHTACVSFWWHTIQTPVSWWQQDMWTGSMSGCEVPLVGSLSIYKLPGDLSIIKWHHSHNHKSVTTRNTFDKISLSGHSCWFAYFKLEIVCSWTCNICCWGNAKWGSWDLNLLLLKLVWISTVLKCRSYISSDGLFQVCKCMSETWMCTCMSGIRNTHLIMAWCKIKAPTL